MLSTNSMDDRRHDRCQSGADRSVDRDLKLTRVMVTQDMAAQTKDVDDR
jgi:hypothetical protein